MPPTNHGEFVKIDTSFLPAGFVTQGGEGLVAELYPDGQLRTLSVRAGGRRVSSELRLAEGKAAGDLVDPPSPGSTSSWDSYRNGAVEAFDAWSDNSRPSPRPWLEWVTASIARVCKEWEKSQSAEHPLHRAARAGDLDAVARKGASAAQREAKNGQGRTALIEAAACGQLAAVRLLLDLGAELDARERVWVMDRQEWVAGASALSAALRADHPDVARDLLSRGANVELADAEGLTPLMHAASAGRVELVEILLGKGASLEAEKRDPKGPGIRALHVAVKHLEVVRVLLDAGAAVQPKDAHGRTPVRCAVDARAPASVLRLLLSRGADPHGPPAWPTLAVAVNAGAPELIKILLEHGASLTARDRWGKTALDSARGWRASKNPSANGVTIATWDEVIAVLEEAEGAEGN